MTKPSEAALKAAREIEADVSLTENLYFVSTDASTFRHKQAVEQLAVRIDAAADEKYAGMLTQVEMVLSSSDGKIKTLLRRLDGLRDAFRNLTSIYHHGRLEE